MLRKKHLAIIFLFMLIFGSLTSPPKVGEKQEVSQVPPSFLPNPVKGSEEENIDSWTVHPASGRWAFVEDTGLTDTIDNGILNITDTGDGTLDRYRIERELKTLDDSFEIRFRIKFYGSGFISNNDIFSVSLAGGTDLSDGNFILYCNEMNNTGFFEDTSISYKAVSGTTYTYDFDDDTGSVVNNTWYTLKVDYDLLRSKIQFELLANGSNRLWKVDEEDIVDPDDLPLLFAKEKVRITITARDKSLNNEFVFNIDYIEASFKEKEWEQVDTPGDADWLADSWDAAYVQDDIADRSEYELVVPYLDKVSGIIVNIKTGTLLSASEDIFVRFRLLAVDGDDGDVHEVFELRADFSVNPGPDQYAEVLIQADESTVFTDQPTAGDADEIKLGFTITLDEDRSKAVLKIEFLFDNDPTATTEDSSFVYEIAIAACADDPSTEFKLEMSYAYTMTTNIFGKAYLSQFNAYERNLFDDLFGWIPDLVEGLFAWFLESLGLIFVILFRFLADIWKVVGEAIVAGIGGFMALLEVAIDALAPLLTSIAGWLSDVVDAVVALVVGIGDYLLTLIGDFVDGAITFLLTIISDLVDLGAGIFFAIWDGLGLPDVLLWFDALNDVFTGGLGILVDTITFFIAILAVAAGLLFVIHFFIPLIIGDSQGGYWEAWFSVAGFDITFGLTLLGFRANIPLIIPSFLIWLSVLVTTPYIGFF